MSTAVAGSGPAREAAPSAAREAVAGGVGLLVLGLVGYGGWLGFQVSNLHNALLAVTFSAVGLYVVRMRPGHRVGLLFVVAGLQAAVMYFGRQYGLHQPALPGNDWLAWLSIWQVPLAMALAGVAIMVFPTGSLLSPRWRVPAVTMVVLAGLLSVASALWPIEDDWGSDVLDFPFDVEGQGTAVAVLRPALAACYLAFLLLWLVAVVARVRRATGDELRQLRWFGFAVAVVALVMVGGVVVAGQPLPGLLATALIPLAAGVAVLKFRLYDIDPVINKSLVVGAMTLVVTVGYIAVVAGAGALLPVSDRVLALVATALVAVAFEPLRRRAQRLADRLVYGHRATPYETLSQLATRLTDPGEGLLEALAATVASGVGATTVVVWVGDADRLEPVAAWPPGAIPAGPATMTGIGGTREVVRPVLHEGVVRGALMVGKPVGEALSAAEERLLGDLVAQTGLLVDHRARLEQVARQAADLRAAARRIVTAQDAARRRIERDLHDGAQQRLVTVGLELGALAERAAADGHTELAERAAAARRRLLGATAELREMARGLHPAVLTQDGLEEALANLADRSPVPVRLSVDVDRRLPPEVEATAYFLVSEAITNAARHAAADVVDVHTSFDGGRLRVEVCDDGRGGADPAGGTGLQGLADRLAALGARLEVVSPPGGGTVLRTVVPCG